MDPLIVRLVQVLASKYPKDKELHDLAKEITEASAAAPAITVRGYGPPTFKVEYDNGDLTEIEGWREMATFLGVTETSLRVRMSTHKYCLLRTYMDGTRGRRKMRITRVGRVSPDHPDLQVDLLAGNAKPGPKPKEIDPRFTPYDPGPRPSARIRRK